MKEISLRKIVVAIVILGVGAGFVQADRQELLKMLSTKQAEFEFQEITIAEALDSIGQELEAKIVLSDEAEWKLPQGGATKLSASIKGDLSDCLTEMFNAFFMRYAVGDDEIKIYPRQELEHILGRPNSKQLELLKNIYAMKLSFSGNFPIENAQELVRRAFSDVAFLPYDSPKMMSEILKDMSTEKGIDPVSFAVLLEQVCDRHNWSTWYLSGMDFPDQVPMIKFVNEQEYCQDKLEQIVDISFKDETAVVILQRLAGWTGMELFVDKADPSWLEGEIVVNMQNIKLSQALRNIVSSLDGETFIDFGGNYIEIKGPLHTKKVVSPKVTKSSGGASEGYVGKISIPMGEGESKYFIEFMMRERDLTEGLKKLREEKIKEILMKFSKVGEKAKEIAARPQSYSILN